MPSDNDPNPGSFEDFINNSLDLGGIDGLDPAQIAAKMHDLLSELPANVTRDVWDDRLERLQAVIRLSLDLEMILSAFKERPDLEQFNRDDLESLVMLSVTFGFISYNHLRPAYAVDEPKSDDALIARRLRSTLSIAFDWVKQAAEAGDPVAQKLVPEIVALLNITGRPD